MSDLPQGEVRELPQATTFALMRFRAEIQQIEERRLQYLRGYFDAINVDVDKNDIRISDDATTYELVPRG